jgi:hypothetical protein
MPSAREEDRMMKKIAVVGLLVLGCAVAWRARDASNPKLIFDRFWLDRLPRGPNDQFQGLFVHGERPFGHFSVQTPWKGQWEGFHYHIVPRTDGQLDLLFPSSERQERVIFRARACQENGFDYCLEVTGSSRGARRYFSKRGFESKDGDFDVLRAAAAGY